MADLLAGTGAVGIEALSRGAEKVYFVETSRRAIVSSSGT
jgi:16S rRNA G966 N2-methylase RsmD